MAKKAGIKEVAAKAKPAVKTFQQDYKAGSGTSKALKQAALKSYVPGTKPTAGNIPFGNLNLPPETEISTLIGGPNADKLNKKTTLGQWGANIVDAAQRPQQQAKGFLSKPPAPKPMQKQAPAPTAKPQAPRYAQEAARLRGQMTSPNITPEQKARIEQRMQFKGYGQNGPQMGQQQMQKVAPGAANRFFGPSQPGAGNVASPTPGMTQQPEMGGGSAPMPQDMGPAAPMQGGQQMGPGQIPGGQSTADPWMQALQQKRPMDYTSLAQSSGQGDYGGEYDYLKLLKQQGPGQPMRPPQMTPPMGGFSGGPQSYATQPGQQQFLNQMRKRRPIQPMQPGMGQGMPSIPQDPTKFQY